MTFMLGAFMGGLEQGASAAMKLGNEYQDWSDRQDAKSALQNAKNSDKAGQGAASMGAGPPQADMSGGATPGATPPAGATQYQDKPMDTTGMTANPYTAADALMMGRNTGSAVASAFSPKSSGPNAPSDSAASAPPPPQPQAVPTGPDVAGQQISKYPWGTPAQTPSQIPPSQRPQPANPNPANPYTPSYQHYLPPQQQAVPTGPQQQAVGGGVQQRTPPNLANPSNNTGESILNAMGGL